MRTWRMAFDTEDKGQRLEILRKVADAEGLIKSWYNINKDEESIKVESGEEYYMEMTGGRWSALVTLERVER